ncbi:unnamed protein product [Owenia fusiformis]|uniref:Uncharacterized protein n=1 Tax=Owenia fusiformis TaxID=6347 RepID=A0A8S4PWH5_OWEFU|nr:unnamed protein product [Owenia fusiformis]
MLNTMNTWCCKWRMTVNAMNTNIIHHRPKDYMRSQFVFRCGDDVIEYATQYKYLGLTLNEHMDMSKSVSILAKSATCALGAIMTKFRLKGGMNYNVYTQLYDSMVEPILLYAAGTWSANVTSGAPAVKIQNKAEHFYMGVGKCAPNDATRGDMCWTDPNVRQKVEKARQWCRFKNMNNDRITKRIHNCWTDPIMGL